MFRALPTDSASSQFVSRLNLADSWEFLLSRSVPERGGVTLGERPVHVCEWSPSFNNLAPALAGVYQALLLSRRDRTGAPVTVRPWVTMSGVYTE